MEYKSLKTIYYQNSNEYEQEYLRRLEGFGTIRTNLFPYLMKRQEIVSSQFPIFTIPVIENQMLIQQIVDNSSKISQLANQLPEIAHQQFYIEQIFSAIISSNEIEGIETTRQDISKALNAIKENQKEIVKHKSTTRMYLNILSSQHLHIRTLQDIRDIYDELTEGEIDPQDKIDGELFRKENVSIVNNKSGKIEHIPPGSEEKSLRCLTYGLILLIKKMYLF